MTTETSMKNQISHELDEEPPGTTATRKKVEEEEPPSHCITSNRRRFFSDVPEASWNDWRWHFQNRITTVDELAKFIPLSEKER